MAWYGAVGTLWYGMVRLVQYDMVHAVFHLAWQSLSSLGPQQTTGGQQEQPLGQSVTSNAARGGGLLGALRYECMMSSEAE
jgi:hypothetical protein